MTFELLMIAKPEIRFGIRRNVAEKLPEVRGKPRRLVLLRRGPSDANNRHGCRDDQPAGLLSMIASIRLEGTMRARGRHEGNEHHNEHHSAVKMIVQNPGDPKPVATIPPDEDAEAIPEAVVNTPRIGFPALREPIRSYQLAFRHGL
jgi:hypothetical protein